MRTILVIDDDKELLDLFQHRFRKELEVEFSLASSYSEGVSLIASRKYDLYILDLNLGDYSGFDILKLLQKEENINNRIIIMSAERSSEKRIRAYDLGAANFIAKPLHFDLLRAMTKKNLRALDGSQPHRVFTKAFTLDLRMHQCFKQAGEQTFEIDLTPVEFNILFELAQNKNKVHRKEDLSFLGKDQNDPMSFKALEMHISSLRKKLGENVILTKRGIGYYLNE